MAAVGCVIGGLGVGRARSELVDTSGVRLQETYTKAEAFGQTVDLPVISRTHPVTAIVEHVHTSHANSFPSGRRPPGD